LQNIPLASRVSEETRSLQSDVEWRQLIGLRNRIVHEYFGVDTAIVWQIITQDLPALRRRLDSLLARLVAE
jgi:uncharacterized protein with HEPN domain